MLKDVPRMLVDPRHALVIRWKRLLPSLPWFVKFARTLKPERLEAIARVRAGLLTNAATAYDGLLTSIGRPELIYQSGLIFAYESAASFRGARYGIELRRRTGIEVRVSAVSALETI